MRETDNILGILLGRSNFHSLDDPDELPNGEGVMSRH